MVQEASSKQRPTVFIVDNDRATRESLAWLFASVELDAATFDTAETFLAAYRPEQPGCLVLDVRLPGMSGLVLQEELQRREYRLPVIVITGFADVPTAVQSLKRGAFDFFEKPLVAEQLLDCARRAVDVDAQQRGKQAERELLNARLACLTAREREVFDLIVQGKANKVVAYDLGIAEKTVEVHRARVMQKLRAGNLAELVRMDLLACQSEWSVPPWMHVAALPPTRLHATPRAA